MLSHSLSSVPRKNHQNSSIMLLNKLQLVTPLNSLEKLRLKGQFDVEPISTGSKMAFTKKFNEEATRSQVKLSLPSIALSREDATQHKNSQLQMIYHNNMRLPPRLPKLESSVEVGDRAPNRKKYGSYDPSTVTLTSEAEMTADGGGGGQRASQKKHTQQQLSPRSPPQPFDLVFTSRTKGGCQGNKALKTNQDAMITNQRNLQSLGYQFFAVCDGHGVNGHIVSGLIKNQLPSKYLARHLRDDPLQIQANLTRAFLETNKEIFQANLDTNLSGSTTVSLLIKKDQIWCANVGDSRAIMCRHVDKKMWSVVELSQDHKPGEEKERQRILDAGGRIEAQKDFYGNPIGPERVWLSYIDAPGLAMTRSMGDKVGAQAGVIGEPELLECTMTEEDRFIVVASDGVWEYLSNEDVMNIIIPHLDDIEHACDKVIVESTAAWRQRSFARDDISCIILLIA